MKMVYHGIVCDVKARENLSAEIGELCPEAVAYAVCRLFTKSVSLRKAYVPESYRMRLASGKGRKTKRHRCVIPACLAEIDGELLQIDFSVDCTGVTVQKVKALRYIS